MGEYVVASGSAQVVIGKFNKQDNGDSLFVIGNGFNNDSRNDVFLVNSGSVMIGSGSLPAETFFYVGTNGNKDNAYFSGSMTVSGSATIGNQWQSYTPTIDATISGPTLPTTKWLYGKYYLFGKKMTLIFNLGYSSTAGGANGNGGYLIKMPTGYTIDTNVSPVGTGANSYLDGISLGTGILMADTTIGPVPAVVIPYDQDYLMLIVQQPGSSTQPYRWGSGSNTLFAITDYADTRVSFTVEIPIL
jgi:hypothetical protein